MTRVRFPLALLDRPVIAQIRRNHALEHATMHVLGERGHNLKLMGRSSLWGFYIYGNVPTERLLSAAQEALSRLKAGQRSLAIHPNCGSNLIVAGTLAGLCALIALSGKPRNRLERFARIPFACAAATLGMIVAPPFGSLFQAHISTRADLGNLQITGITREKKASLQIHHIRTRHRGRRRQKKPQLLASS